MPPDDSNSNNSNEDFSNRKIKPSPRAFKAEVFF